MLTSALEKLGHPAIVSPAATKSAVISVPNACRRTGLQFGRCIWCQALMKCVAGGRENGGSCVAILAHRCARTQRRCKCIYDVCAWRERAHLDVLWRHSRKHTDLATEYMLHPLQNLASDAFSAPGSCVLSRVLRTLNNASSRSCSSISFC